MDKFTTLTGTAAPLMIADINTDAIIRSPWNKASQPGKRLFANWRLDSEGREVPDFPLNQAKFRNAKILVAGPNFGCGSSREGAVYALMEYGITCVIAESFGEIFTLNAYQNGLLPVVLPAAQVAALVAGLETSNQPSLTVDLDRCVVETGDGRQMGFKLPPEKRRALLLGQEEIDMILDQEAAIDAFQAADHTRRPWAWQG